jgi:hypothetical protein
MGAVVDASEMVESMNFLVTQCTVYDLAGVAMIQGLMNGFKMLGTDCKIRALVAKEDNTENPVCKTYEIPDDVTAAFKWADAILDVGGLCKEHSPQRLLYIHRSGITKIPYVYMSQSFIRPNPNLFNGVAAVIARGQRAADEVRRASKDVRLEVAADLGFLVEPELSQHSYNYGFTTYLNRNLINMTRFIRDECIKDQTVQFVWKESRRKIYEPKLELTQCNPLSIEQMFGMIADLKVMHTARYHAGVAAILSAVGLRLYPLETNQSKYDDLKDFEHMSKDELIQSALISCKVVLEVMDDCY